MFKSQCPTIQAELMLNGTFNARVPGSLTTYNVRSASALIRGAANNHVGAIVWRRVERPAIEEPTRRNSST